LIVLHIFLIGQCACVRYHISYVCSFSTSYRPYVTRRITRISWLAKDYAYAYDFTITICLQLYDNRRTWQGNYKTQISLHGHSV